MDNIIGIFAVSTYNTDYILTKADNYDRALSVLEVAGYMTAWFMWQLQGDDEAARAFTGDNAEILNNELYQNQQTSIR